MCLVDAEGRIELFHSEAAIFGLKNHSIESHCAEYCVVGGESCLLFIIDSLNYCSLDNEDEQEPDNFLHLY